MAQINGRDELSIKEKVETPIGHPNRRNEAVPFLKEKFVKNASPYLKEEANSICSNILDNYNYDNLKIHLPILEYCAHQGIKKAQDYIEKYYENLELINTQTV